MSHTHTPQQSWLPTLPLTSHVSPTLPLTSHVSPLKTSHVLPCTTITSPPTLPPLPVMDPHTPPPPPRSCLLTLSRTCHISPHSPYQSCLPTLSLTCHISPTLPSPVMAHHTLPHQTYLLHTPPHQSCLLLEDQSYPPPDYYRQHNTCMFIHRADHLHPAEIFSTITLPASPS